MHQLSIIRFGGLALAVGSVMFIAGMLIRPSGPIVSTVSDPLSVNELLTVIGENETLTHVSSDILIVSTLLLVFGMVVHMRMQGADGVSNSLINLGLAFTMLALLGYMLFIGLSHVAAQTISGNEPSTLGQNQTSVAIQITRVGISVTAIYVFALGVFFHGIGLYLKLPSGIYRNIALIIAILSIATFVAAIIAQYFGAVTELFYIANAYGVPVSVWYLILGDALYNQNPNFVPRPRIA